VNHLVILYRPEMMALWWKARNKRSALKFAKKLRDTKPGRVVCVAKVNPRTSGLEMRLSSTPHILLNDESPELWKW